MSERDGVLGRLIKYLEFKNIPFARMERMAGFSNGYLRNNKGSISGTKLSEVIECLPELNGDWLLTGRGEMEFSKEEPTEIHQGEHATHGRFAGRDYIENQHGHIIPAVQANIESTQNNTQNIQQTVVILEGGKTRSVGLQELHELYQKLQSLHSSNAQELIDTTRENRQLKEELESLRNRSKS